MKVIIVTLGLAVIFQSTPAHAQLGRLLKEGLELVGKKAFGSTAKNASQEGAEQILRKAATVTVSKAGQEAAEAVAKQAGAVAIGHSEDALKAIATHGAAVTGPLLKNFGDDGAKALMKLSPANARRMAVIADELAARGRGADWVGVVAKGGDRAAQWIWDNKATIGVASAAAAFLANPEPFLNASVRVASKGIETAGEHVARPLIETSVSSIAPPLAKHVANAVSQPVVAMAKASTQSSWPFVLTTLILIATFAAVFRRWLGPWLPQLRRS